MKQETGGKGKPGRGAVKVQVGAIGSPEGEWLVRQASARPCRRSGIVSVDLKRYIPSATPYPQHRTHELLTKFKSFLCQNDTADSVHGGSDIV